MSRKRDARTATAWEARIVWRHGGGLVPVTTHIGTFASKRAAVVAAFEEELRLNTEDGYVVIDWGEGEGVGDGVDPLAGLGEAYRLAVHKLVEGEVSAIEQAQNARDAALAARSHAHNGHRSFVVPVAGVEVSVSASPSPSPSRTTAHNRDGRRA